MGSVWSRLGSEVTVLEFTDALVPSMDEDVAEIFHKTLEKQGIKFSLSTKVESASINNEIVEQFDKEGSPYYATARLWDDGIIDPADTRNVLAASISYTLNATKKNGKFGIFRM